MPEPAAAADPQPDRPRPAPAIAGPWHGRRLHLIGVGGAGMSAYARAASALGAELTGSDQAESAFSSALRADGVLEAAIGHRAENVPPGSAVEVVCSTAIPADNPERVAALERGLAVLTRAQLLAQLTAERRTIAVAGTHGKTTTASMIVAALRAAGVDAGYLIGGILRDTARNGEWTDGEWLVVEADESDRSLLSLDVEIAVLTNVELDHHDAYGSLLEVEQVYREFLSHAAQAVVWDRPQLRALREGPLVTFDATAVTPTASGGSRFRYDGLDVELRLPGEHAARDAAAALAVAGLLGADLSRAAAGLARFSGAARRFQRLGRSERGAEVYDDYAHHPSEIAVNLAAARTLAPARLIAVFQPHLYSRTQALAREFGVALAAADIVAVLDVYPAREAAAEFPGISGLLVAEATADAAAGRPVYWLPRHEDARVVLAGLVGAGDLVLVMGAGDVDALGRALVAADGGDG